MAMAVEAEAALPKLGNEEQQIHDTLTSVAASVRAIIPSLANPTPSSRASAHLIENQVQSKLAQLRCNIRDLELLAEEQDNLDKARSVEAVLKQHRLEYESLHLSISEARLAAKDAIDRAFMQQRKELLSGAALPALQRKPGNESEMVTTASDITASLRRTRQALAQQLDHAAANQSVMNEGNTQLSATKAELSGQQQLIKEGNQGLKQLKKQSTGDRWLLWLGLLVFLLVAGYVGYKRAPPVVKGPMNMAVRLTGNSVWQGSKMVYNGAAFAVRGVIAASKRAKGALDSEDGYDSADYVDPAAIITIDSKKLQPHSHPEPDLIGTGVYDDAHMAAAGRAAGSAFTTDAQLNKTHDSDKEEGTDGIVSFTFAQQAGIADTPHNRQHYAWLFLSTRQQLVAWMRENVHEEWALQWLPTSQLPQDLAVEAWAQARALQRNDDQQDLAAEHQEPVSLGSDKTLSTSGIISQEDREASPTHSSGITQVVSPPDVEPSLPVVTGVAEPVTGPQQSLADLVQHVSILQDIKKERLEQQPEDGQLQEDDPVHSDDGNSDSSSSSTSTVIASKMTSDGSRESGDTPEHHSQSESTQANATSLPGEEMGNAGLQHEKQHASDTVNLQTDTSDSTAAAPPETHRRSIKEAVASLLAEPTDYDNNNNNNDIDLWADLASIGFDTSYDSDDGTDAEAMETATHLGLDNTGDDHSSRSNGKDVLGAEAAVHDNDTAAEKTDTDGQQHDEPGELHQLKDSQQSDMPHITGAAEQTTEEIEQQATAADTDNSNGGHDTPPPNEDFEVVEQVVDVKDKEKEEVTPSDALSPTEDNHPADPVEMHADVMEQQTHAPAPAPAGDVPEDVQLFGDVAVDSLQSADASKLEGTVTDSPLKAQPVEPEDVDLEAALPVDQPGVFTSQGTDLDPVNPVTVDELVTHDDGVLLQSVPVGTNITQDDQKEATDNHDGQQPVPERQPVEVRHQEHESVNISRVDDNGADTKDTDSDSKEADDSSIETVSDTADVTAPDIGEGHEAHGVEQQVVSGQTVEDQDVIDTLHQQNAGLPTTAEQQEEGHGDTTVAGQRVLDDDTEGHIAESMEADATAHQDVPSVAAEDLDDTSTDIPSDLVLDKEHVYEKGSASLHEE